MTNRKHLLAGIILLTILTTACEQSKQATSTVRPPTKEEVTKTIPQKMQPELAQVTEGTRQTYQWYCLSLIHI